MRFLNWNIKQGGGSRIPQICRHIAEVDADLVALTEFQARNESALRVDLRRVGFRFVVTSNPPDRSNGLLVASRWPLRPVQDAPAPQIDRQRSLAVRIDDLDLNILAVHIPGSPDNKFEDGYGISGTKRKELLWERTLSFARDHRDGNAVLLGDFNTGFRADSEGAMFKLSNSMQRLLDIGFVDTWRHHHPHGRDYTWYSKRKDKTTGITEDLNGFRLDYIFASPALLHAIDDAVILHPARMAGTSDHASVITDIDFGQTEEQKTVVDDEPALLLTLPAAHVGRPLDVPGDTTLHCAPPTSRRAPGGSVRLDLAPGSLPDMICGVNGQPFQQEFRPAYVTAEWAGEVLRELRIWGPRVLMDGSLGKRELDHVWTSSSPSGIRNDDLPAEVVTLLDADRSAEEPGS